MPDKRFRSNKLDSTRRGKNAQFGAQGAAWIPISKQSTTKPNFGAGDTTHNSSNHGPAKHAKFFKTHHPARVEKERKLNGRSHRNSPKHQFAPDQSNERKPSLSFLGTKDAELLLEILNEKLENKRPSQSQPHPDRHGPPSPFRHSANSGKRNSIYKDPRDLEAALDKIIGDHKFQSVDNMERDQRLECLERFVQSHKFESVDKPGTKPKTQGYRPPTVEDGANAESANQNKGQKLPATGLVLERISDTPMTEDVGISPGTRVEKTVRWAENIAGPSGTGQPGLNMPVKSAFAQHAPSSNTGGGNLSFWGSGVGKTSQATHNGVQSLIGPALDLQPLPPPTETPKPNKTYSFGTPSVHHTKVPSPPVSPSRSSRFEGNQDPSPPSQNPQPKPTHAFGATSQHSANLPTPPVSSKSPRHQQTQPAPINPQSSDPSLSQPLEKAELEYLQSDHFIPTLIRPVPDLSQVFTCMTSVFGEPGTGVLQTRFVPPSPQKAAFGAASATAGVPAKKEYKGRVYSINRNLKSRHLDIELLRVRVSHAMLLSFNLAPDARRDAVNIGDRADFAIGTSTDLPGRSLIRGADLEERDTSGTGKSNKEREHVGTGILSGRTGNRRRNSDKDAWIIVNGQRKRRRESDDSAFREKEQNINLNKKIARAINEGDLRTVKDVAAGNVGSSTGSGGTGTMFWRFVRVSAVVEVDVKVPGRVGVEKMEETQSAWWAVPEKAIVGMF